jgi:F-type H+-transporting ATPase subunit delta
MNGSVAKRYARALASVAAEETRLEQVAEEIEQVLTWLSDPELAAALASPALSVSDRQRLVASVTNSLALSPTTKNFLRLLAENNRVGELAMIVRAYQALVDQALGRVRGVLRVASPISDTAVAEIAATLERIAGKAVLLKVAIDPALIAGLTVEIEGQVYDGSIRTQLAQLAQAAARARAAD